MSAVQLPRAARWSFTAQWPPRRLGRRFAWLWLAVLLGGLAWASPALLSRLNPPLRTLDVVGRFRHLQPGQIAAAAAVAPGTRWLDADLAAIRRRIAALPWVAAVSVRRRWPDALVLEARERRPLARWNASALLADDAQPFSPPAGELRQAALEALPQLSGPADRAGDVLGVWQRLQPALADTPFSLTALSLDARGEWRAYTATGIELRFGDADPVADVTLLRQVAAPALAPRLTEVAAIDLRYSNGFAVAWTDRRACQSSPAGSARDTAPGCVENLPVSSQAFAAPSASSPAATRGIKDHQP
ncbi:MAG: FtsQ-type POTRA domain-containing protein [Gammaproteobacteria bacterium]|nr:FtsQ-type POTRA domain-containing protein [Gammaproteobacteria bacterium]